MRLIYLLFRSKPRPKLSTPQLLEITTWSLVLCLTIAAMRFSGTPLRPKPPTRRVSPVLMSLIAS